MGKKEDEAKAYAEKVAGFEKALSDYGEAFKAGNITLADKKRVETGTKQAAREWAHRALP